MACPYFFPDQPLEGPRPARAPLGDVFSGTCRAGATPPERSILVDLCNFGYARGRCASYPADGDCDALRYSAVQSGTAAVEVIYIREKEWIPIGFGTISYSRATGELTPATEDRVLARQSAAFAARCPSS